MDHQRKAASRARSAAYAHDGREPGLRPASGGTADGWHPRLAALKDAGYIFLQQGYSAGGMLFRGMSGGLMEALATRMFWHFPSNRPLAELEQELDVIFCSEQASDAVAVARPWEPQSIDACLLLFSSDVYESRRRQRAAVMLALADPGMVFKYPLLAEPLHWDQIDTILVGSQVLQRCRDVVGGVSASDPDESVCRGMRRLADEGLFDKLLEVTAGDRAGWAAAVEDCLARLKCQPASAVRAPE